MTKLETPPVAPPLSERWRSSTARLIMIYGGFFLAWTVLLIGMINWQTATYLEHIVDNILVQRMHYLASIERDRLPTILAATSSLDLPGTMSSGLFDSGGGYLSGEIDKLPADLPQDGLVHELPSGVEHINGMPSSHPRAVAWRLDDGSILLLVRDYWTVDRVGKIIRNSLAWALTLALIPGLLGGYLLSRGPLRRVRRIETAVAPIMRGDLGVRLPISDRRDEVDMLASIVNRMLDRIENLLGEVKGVSDNIAHDLRTPLTRLRAQLYRLQRETPGDDTRTATIERCIADTDSLLNRFRALLRISELEDIRRRAGFGEIDLREKLGRVHELYAPLAEDKHIAFALDTPAALAAVSADGDLMFEAISNLVDNAIKFTPAGGRIVLRAVDGKTGPRIDVIDSGPGIPLAEREAVLHRFYRTKACRNEHECEPAGFGLGLSIVSAIVKLHEYRIEIADNDGVPGTRMTIFCAGDSS
ncbi:MAG: HAMP domain-containing histidine kinase [Rudaea sp.]|uniref:sensor histidine kinase n=1 Tax=unclassified Rudaea TaxID=2627037 RepID=UPI0010F4B678|nr:MULTISPECIES: HAMP domain-containing sensor histidine kinase [unclassified Rudaea]MBN8885484.1 HAMP domain-containing histidine kinase [Rudaea sp.]